MLQGLHFLTVVQSIGGDGCLETRFGGVGHPESDQDQEQRESTDTLHVLVWGGRGKDCCVIVTIVHDVRTCWELAVTSSCRTLFNFFSLPGCFSGTLATSGSLVDSIGSIIHPI